MTSTIDSLTESLEKFLLEMLMIIEQVKKFCPSFRTKTYIALLHYYNSVLVKSENHVSMLRPANPTCTTFY